MILTVDKFEHEKNGFSMRNLKYIVHENKINFLIGKNGSGKTTLLDIFLGLNNNGVISKDYIIENDYIYINQMIPMLGSLYCHEIVQLILGLEFNVSNLQLNDLEEKIDPFSFNFIKDHWKKKYRDLSGGEKKLFQQILFVQFNKSIFVFDEPTNFLDREHVQKLFNIINRKPNKTIIIVTHNYRDLKMVDDYQVTLIDSGKIKGSFNKKEFETRENPKNYLMYFKEW